MDKQDFRIGILANELPCKVMLFLRYKTFLRQFLLVKATELFEFDINHNTKCVVNVIITHFTHGCVSNVSIAENHIVFFTLHTGYS